MRFNQKVLYSSQSKGKNGNDASMAALRPVSSQDGRHLLRTGQNTGQVPWAFEGMDKYAIDMFNQSSKQAIRLLKGSHTTNSNQFYVLKTITFVQRNTLGTSKECPYFKYPYFRKFQWTAFRKVIWEQVRCLRFTGCPHFAGLPFTGFSVISGITAKPVK
jgi:hypothetical protein